MILYGGVNHPTRHKDAVATAVCRACSILGVERLISFGPGRIDSALYALPVESMGMLSKDDASELLKVSRVGYLDYFDGYLAKSGIFAAYCAHGLVPLLLHKNRSDADGLTMATHYWVTEQMPAETGLAAQQRTAEKACQWYGDHSLAETARIVASRLVFDRLSVTTNVG